MPEAFKARLFRPICTGEARVSSRHFSAPSLTASLLMSTCQGWTGVTGWFFASFTPFVLASPATTALLATIFVATGFAFGSKLIRPAPSRATDSTGASISTRDSLATRSSGRTSSSATCSLSMANTSPLMPPAPVGRRASASRTLAAVMVPKILSDGDAVCSKASLTSACNTPACNRKGRLAGKYPR